jgi:hypothetical protein
VANPQKRKANPSAQQHQDPLLSHPAKEPAKNTKFTHSRDTIFAEYVGDNTHRERVHVVGPQKKQGYLEGVQQAPADLDSAALAIRHLVPNKNNRNKLQICPFVTCLGCIHYCTFTWHLL